ncbi:hypothetical protein U7230_15095 [Carboxydochorda subterranea]|uniref:Ribbon-helix-helix CopG family protein n=1 Tax=Carboxydichorda subterranea TaxID=3109565 RepID=A0ABZ1BXG7_9FIRM|nr:hypothetical protein [Limnochorda sp. L945t]WRP17384.1 hypothetical protein U7230_15095 [Limnochorda sp. L945t]
MKLQVYVDPAIADRLRAMAREHRLPVGRAAAHTLEQAVREQQDDRAQASSLHDQLWYQSVQRLKQPLAEVEEILSALPPQEAQSLAPVLNAAPPERRDRERT